MCRAGAKAKPGSAECPELCSLPPPYQLLSVWVCWAGPGPTSCPPSFLPTRMALCTGHCCVLKVESGSQSRCIGEFVFWGPLENKHCSFLNSRWLPPTQANLRLSMPRSLVPLTCCNRLSLAPLLRWRLLLVGHVSAYLPAPQHS